MAEERHYVSFSHTPEDDLDTDSLSESADHDPLRSSPGAGHNEDTAREILRRASLREVCVFYYRLAHGLSTTIH
jgi:hypothetical protein